MVDVQGPQVAHHIPQYETLMWLILAVQGELVLVEIALIAVSLLSTASGTVVVLFTTTFSVIAATVTVVPWYLRLSIRTGEPVR